MRIDHMMRNALALFVAATLAACATAPAGPATPATQAVQVQAADGLAGAILATPEDGARHPAVILWPDLSGLRPAYADMAIEIAEAGYVVLVPNAFYRSVSLDGSPATAQPRMPFGETMQRGAPWREAASDAAIIADTRAYVAYLDSLGSVDAAAGIGTVGIDIGGAHAFVAARAMPDRVRAVAAIHPLAIATSRDTSPHLFVDQSKAGYLIEIASADDEREPGDKDDLRTAFAEAGLTGQVAIIDAPHGYYVADDPGYDETAAKAARDAVIALLDQELK
ncbi:dienelactone hydrolase family protein [Aurantiacibacter rhizosphaerae]|uniref:Dienelactone hydrolase family protein n=1 Tax=Aurantiacibacter rhizosphaerae TaxID=2691582 RepID=A0A844XAE0_9SPHN|nr:dienelactone hydrolase family protein [Aurantiacibacter rhizosphaerae]MWV27431.1 dienelactone hydrolase family protein [Aurantiacibacter rhizosphaerae]